MIAGYIEVIKHSFILTAYIDATKAEVVAGPWPCAIGSNPDGADKQTVGDCRTPEGRHLIVSVEDSHVWKDDKGYLAYGPWFLRLQGQEAANAAWTGIGIHGTHEPESMGHKASHGCVRLTNERSTFLKDLVRAGETVVVILP
jgi:lipoprotein-anchoring transpeptidase ErfK/SrfK